MNIVDLVNLYYSQSDEDERAETAYQIGLATVDVYPCIYDGSFKVSAAALMGALNSGLSYGKASISCRGCFTLNVVIALHSYLTKIAHL